MSAVQRSESVLSQPARAEAARVSVRPLGEAELLKADRIFRLAFGTFIGLPDPSTFGEDRQFVRPRWQVNPSASLGAECDGELIGSNFATAWGSVGFFGPLTVRPEFWDAGVGKRLMERTMPLFDSWGVRHAGLFTFAQSPKHVGLYQKFGFFPRFLTAVMTKPVAPVPWPGGVSRFSELSENQQIQVLRACRELTELLFPGLSLETEIRSVQQHRLGETLVLWDGARLDAFAVCHFGEGTEGGRGCCYVKFGGTRPGLQAPAKFERLLEACEALAGAERLPCLEAGVSMARDDAYHRMAARGFRTMIQGVAMHRPNESCYHRPDVYVIDDWR